MFFFNDQIMPYLNATSLLSYNGPPFASKLFAALFSLLGTVLTTITAYHPQSNGQTERYNETIVARVRHYVEEHQSNWDAAFQSLMCAYNNQFHISTGTTIFNLIFSLHPPNHKIPRSTGMQADSTGSSSARMVN